MPLILIDVSTIINLVTVLTELHMFIMFEVTDDSCDVSDVVKVITILKEVQVFLVQGYGWILVAKTRSEFTDVEHMNVHVKVIRCDFHVSIGRVVEVRDLDC